jgi:hypothetical protein
MAILIQLSKVYDTCCTCKEWHPLTVLYQGERIIVCRDCHSVREFPNAKDRGEPAQRGDRFSGLEFEQ